MPNVPIAPNLPSDEDAVQAAALSRELEQHDPNNTALRVQISATGHETTTLDLPPVVARLLKDILKQVAAGNAVTLVSLEAEITTQQAAELLHVSRPYLVNMIENGALPVRMVGNQRRLPLKDVLAYKADNRAKRRQTLRELAAYDQELGLE